MNATATKEPEIVTDRERTTSLVRLDPQALIAQAIAAGSGIEMMERLVALAKDVREVQAKEAWYAAMAEFQRTCPSIKKTKRAKIATRGGGTYEYSYAPLDEITSVIQPVMGPLGLSVSWRSRVEPAQVIVSCRISHTFGHHEDSGDIAIPIMPSDGTGANAMQRVGISATYAKRYSLLGAIGMAPEDDDDTASQAGQRDARPSRAEDAPPTDGDGTGALFGDEQPITSQQQKRLWAIAREHVWTEEQVHDLLTVNQRNSTKEIQRGEYDRVIDKLKSGPATKPAA